VEEREEDVLIQPVRLELPKVDTSGDDAENGPNQLQQRHGEGVEHAESVVHAA
jgi:hypothetical protein